MDLIRVQGCANKQNILGILFDELGTEHIVPLKVKVCRRKYSAECNIEDCHRYRIGTKGSHKVSWDIKGKRI